ncbi:A-kinase anchor protein 13-like isoform X4 [Argiope bruennichi]|uniref:A-kinase anchor protein 13-like isoform X4 n=1 Tax=Argiope bruennichi TaxID=94029 RepID=UPI002493E536|nr:A-kinase anchor protein 13-like isoform X4 [Argiope bruennichi]
MALRSRGSSSESEGDAVDSSVKILINDVTPCDSREFLHLPSILLQCPIPMQADKLPEKGPLQRRASWTCSRNPETVVKITRCWSLGVLITDLEHAIKRTTEEIIFRSRFSTTKEGSSDSIPDGIKDKQRSFSAGSGDDVFNFCNQLQDSVQSMNDVMPSNQARSLSISIGEPKVAKKNSLTALESKNSGKEEWLIAPRSTLQKSVSTPSIVAAQEIQEIAHRRDGRDSSFGRNRFSFQNVRNSCIEIMHEDDEEQEDVNIKRLSTFSLAGLFRENLLKTGAQDGEDDKPFSKRKKRGSLFFRKKKNKEKENKKNSSHHFVSICYSTAATCDVCSRGLANKSALKCENCSVTVHDSSCKDHVPHCIQSKVPSTADKEANSSLLIPSGSVRYPSRYRHLVGVPTLTHSQSLIHIGKHPQPNKEKKSSLTDSTRINVTSAEPTKTSSSSSNKVICEEKEVEAVEDINTNILETNSASMESLDDGCQGTSDVEDETMLQLLDDEPESWNGTVDKKILKKLKDKDLKRQEAIYELILTEKHHCLTLKVMQRVFAKGMIQELNHSKDMVQRLFPCLELLLKYHLSFLQKLRERQRMEPVVSHIGDVLLHQFTGQSAEDLCQYYSQFCSQHKEALSLYKDILKTDRKFQSFVKRSSTKPFCKSRGIPECILLITQRLTKYPLLIDALIKTTKDNKVEIERLHKALINIKEIVEQVNAAVAEKDRESRLLEIYNRIDAKSTAFFRRKKFKKSDLLSDGRKLRYEGTLECKSARGKVIDVHVIILSDVIVLLQENNQKYTFASLDNKAAVISLPKLLVREKAGQNSKGLYLISSNPSDPEMYEMLASSPKDKKVWLQVFRDAVAMATQEARATAALEVDEDQGIEDEIATKISDLCATMQEKDVEIVTLCEEKLKAMYSALELIGFDKQKMPNVDLQQFLQKDEEETENLLVSYLDQACSIASRMLYFDTSPYSNSIEYTTSANMSPILPKRAETFGGFDNSGREVTDKVSVLKRKLMQLKEMDGDCHGDRELSCSDSSLHIKPKTEGVPNMKFISSLKSPETASSGNASSSSFQSGYNRIEEVAELNHLLANVTSLVHHHLSVYRKEYGKRRYRPDHQLEELRNIQEKLSQERLQWEQEKAKKEKELEKKKQELLQMEKRICGEQASTDFNKLTCNFPDQVCDHNCPSLSLCRHRRSASFDFRTLGNLTHDVGGRQSWSGPIDDASLSWHQHFCATQSTSNIPQAVISVPTAPHSNQNSHDKSPEANSSPGTDSRRVSASDGASSPSITKNCKNDQNFNRCPCTPPLESNDKELNHTTKSFCRCQDSL